MQIYYKLSAQVSGRDPSYIEYHWRSNDHLSKHGKPRQMCQSATKPPKHWVETSLNYHIFDNYWWPRHHLAIGAHHRKSAQLSYDSTGERLPKFWYPLQPSYVSIDMENFPWNLYISWTSKSDSVFLESIVRIYWQVMSNTKIVVN